MKKNMNNKRYQKIYKRSAVERLRAQLRSGESLKTYFQSSYPVKEKDLILSTIEVQGKPPSLKVSKKNLALSDLDNAIALYEYYKNIDETQASDPRLWAYLSHAEFRKYTISRWGLSGTYGDLVDDSAKRSAINQTLEHWFVSGNDRDLRRHSIARLWWAAHLTYAPWERDPDFFSDLKKDDPYYFTRILLSAQDIYQQVLERAMGRSQRILISILEYLGKNKKFAESRENVRNLAKELNLVYGVKKIIMLDRKSLKELIEKTGKEAQSVVAPPNQMPKRGKPLESIINLVADYYGVKPADITGKRRKREFVTPRMVAAFLMRSKLDASFPEIGRMLGGKDHTTAIHAYKKISRECDRDGKIKKDVEKLEEKIKIMGGNTKIYD